jgi:hypothetical protein
LIGKRNFSLYLVDHALKGISPGFMKIIIDPHESQFSDKKETDFNFFFQVTQKLTIRIKSSNLTINGPNKILKSKKFYSLLHPVLKKIRNCKQY